MPVSMAFWVRLGAVSVRESARRVANSGAYGKGPTPESRSDVGPDLLGAILCYGLTIGRKMVWKGGLIPGTAITAGISYGKGAPACGTNSNQ